ncbi:hypothetical protein [Mycolicibacterium fortuitum]|jgi:hypothetical protein|uniref:Uncharacterized protein n=3 Tax=Mycolicibacterium fortuitum TaxID=1766 RepID=A0A378V2L1_MYCFO|nr:hypothetical protein [Mycolicibacterium fortuitum]AIY44732.1 hypothetical protein G155_03140 [Mycobacterium sp. VKM Ac-1817D]CRL79627.1 hypothetical protein CPGR_02822 [Mycolicibacter nonchromogenicus]AMD53790.1 hypothetical protein ATO49_02650 [Mycolicibacterium fortuitum subsp. fortuitum DSM 46621 = ATCC 6841 = JCM 6387]EJZ15776.1 hypothetical protein MFORT_02664 [Mycolicibacterium fortuitum subsp. fortuitum DSM 46621 = ATCC 6841 = JCM 6387]MCV7142000.1 hypothetical protein [Mycolicibacte
MALILRKLMHIGALPEGLRTEAEAEGILFLAEYVPVTRRFTGSIPGKRSTGSVASYAGALVMTNYRALATMSTLPKLAGRSLDQPWSAPQVGAVHAELDPSGLTLTADLAQIDRRCRGELSLHYKTAIPADVLAQLPRTSLAFDVGPEYVFRAVGVPYHP